MATSAAVEFVDATAAVAFVVAVVAAAAEFVAAVGVVGVAVGGDDADGPETELAAAAPVDPPEIVPAMLKRWHASLPRCLEVYGRQNGWYWKSAAELQSAGAMGDMVKLYLKIQLAEDRRSDYSHLHEVRQRMATYRPISTPRIEGGAL